MTSGNMHFSVDDAHRALTNELTAVGCWNIRPAKKQVAILEYLLTWFFFGPTYYLTDGQQPVRIGEFLTNANLSNMFAVGLAFPAYEGTNTAHPI
jgi:hypothetical protein